MPTCITPTSTTSNLKLDPNEPPTKLIKLINGSAILTSPMDKDSKMVHQGQLTLQQVIRWLVLFFKHSTDFEGFTGRWRRWTCSESDSVGNIDAGIEIHRAT
jgi:hypothetical protein